MPKLSFVAKLENLMPISKNNTKKIQNWQTKFFYSPVPSKMQNLTS